MAQAAVEKMNNVVDLPPEMMTCGMYRNAACSLEPVPELSKQKDVILIVYEAKDGQMIFTEKNLKEMKEIFDFITLNPRFPEFCWKISNTFNDTDTPCLGGASFIKSSF